MSTIAIIIGGAVGALVFIAVIIGFIWLYKSCKNFSRRNSDTGSSDPSALMEWNKGAGPSSSAGPQGARQFRLEELEQATKQFADSNLIGFGSFGPVYKGWIHDNVVAIKRHSGLPREVFVAGVIYLSEIRHRNLVTLLGYCQESGSHMLVYECIPNGSMCNHLYDTGREAPTRLEFKQRLSIALGAARGLCHLHSLKPPLIHKNFKTANVLVDENFTAKVADAGIVMLLEKIEEAGPSHSSNINVFRDPEVEALGSFTEMSDVYGFGVFLLELITGREEAVHIDYLRSNESLIQMVQSRLNSNEFVDRRLVGSFTMDGIKDLIKLTLKCMCFPGKRRPNMNMVLVELERIHEKEMELTTVRGEGTSKITLGSELFASK
ncbi:hypothetical protein like AT3G26700 [Hibiscus trionum]|uniref:non-specific serine/threonine protein kinase n=1 Tax=Hibiscus trionum TaxID=183268 RepID=A0A9W7LW91_HIBTR|nr:hypothetical protein like AT3G26700 [Hibiscus trionum]